MTFPLDPGLRAFQAKEAEHVLIPDQQAPPVPPESFQAEDAEHAIVTAPAPADAEAPPADVA
jgi:hypothetical protein